MIQPRLNINFDIKKQISFFFRKEYIPYENEYLLNHARTGIVMALRAALPQGGRVGVVAYNCYTVANAIVQAGCHPVFVDVNDSLQMDTQHISSLDIDAIIVTNLFGIRNDVSAIREVIGDKPIIVDNAHGYGLPTEGDFTVYSINQGKFPAVGEGGILFVNNKQYAATIQAKYQQLPTYSFLHSCKLFCTMAVKSLLHRPLIYTLFTKPLKAHRKVGDIRQSTPLRQMAHGVRRIYNAILPSVDKQIAQQHTQADVIRKALSTVENVKQVYVGENAFMVVVRTQQPQILMQWFACRGVETATHFGNAITWAKQFGYQIGTCPVAEQMTKELLMIPTYKQFEL